MIAQPPHSMETHQLGLGSSAVARRLRDTLGNRLIARGQPGYERSRSIWNAMIDKRPAMIAQCQNADEVALCVRTAQAHALPLSVRGGGHNIGGRALVHGGLTIDLSAQREVRLDPNAASASVAPGATLGDVDRATTPHGLVLPAGIMSETGVAGLTLGGGFGWLSRRFGLTCDHLRAAEVVTGTGERIVATEREHEDLLWALRGGGGCAIVTRFVFDLRPFDPTVTAGPIVRPAAQVETAFELFRACVQGASEKLTCLLKLCAAPPAPFLPAAMHGRPAAFTVACHSGPVDQADQEIAVLRRDPAPVADLAERRPFAAFQKMFDAGEPSGRRNYWKSEYISDLDDDVAALLLEAAGRLPSPHANIKVFQLGGEVAREPAGPTAAAHRDARFIVVIASAWERSDDDAENIEWVRETWQRLHAHSGRGGYVNFLTEDTTKDEQDLAHAGVDVGRLADVARRYDPEGLIKRM